MKPIIPSCLRPVVVAAILIPAFALAKDAPISLDQCPAPVQALISHYSKQGTFEEVTLDEKKKSGGPAVYEAKFTLTDGRRIEIHMSPEGKVIKFEEKKAKS
jgi:hypothetical protein